MRAQRTDRVRRHLLRGGALVALGSAVPLAACSKVARGHLGGYQDTVRLLDFFAVANDLQSSGVWSPAQIFAHCAQSVEFSLRGFPELKPALFLRTVGPAAASLFAGLGRMQHDLAEPIPGAPVLPPNLQYGASLLRLRAAFEAFRAHRGKLHPHFAYGALAHEDYLFAHVLHLDNHLDELHPLPAFLQGSAA